MSYLVTAVAAIAASQVRFDADDEVGDNLLRSRGLGGRGLRQPDGGDLLGHAQALLVTDYFTLDPTTKATRDPAVVKSALRRAWNACASVPCSKCGVAAGQYCRNRTRGTWWVTRFHRPRQDAAGATRILAKVWIHGLSWAKGNGTFAWDDRAVPTM